MAEYDERASRYSIHRNNANCDNGHDHKPKVTQRLRSTGEDFKVRKKFLKRDNLYFKSNDGGSQGSIVGSTPNFINNRTPNGKDLLSFDHSEVNVSANFG